MEHLTKILAVPITADGVATTLENVFDTLQASGENLQGISFVLTDPMAKVIHERLQQISHFGLPDAFPQVVNITSEESKLVMLEQARNIARRVRLLNQQAGLILGEVRDAPTMAVDKKISMLINAAKIISWGWFQHHALVQISQRKDIRIANDDRAQLFKHAKEKLSMTFVADEWLQNAAHVRPRLANWDCVRTLYETMRQEATENNTLALNPIQLPYRANDSWLN